LVLRSDSSSRYGIGINNTGVFDLYADYLLTSFSFAMAAWTVITAGWAH